MADTTAKAPKAATPGTLARKLNTAIDKLNNKLISCFGTNKEGRPQGEVGEMAANVKAIWAELQKAQGGAPAANGGGRHDTP